MQRHRGGRAAPRSRATRQDSQRRRDRDEESRHDHARGDAQIGHAQAKSRRITSADAALPFGI